jgi:hypothetical protein
MRRPRARCLGALRWRLCTAWRMLLSHIYSLGPWGSEAFYCVCNTYVMSSCASVSGANNKRGARGEEGNLFKKEI